MNANDLNKLTFLKYYQPGANKELKPRSDLIYQPCCTSFIYFQIVNDANVAPFEI